MLQKEKQGDPNKNTDQKAKIGDDEGLKSKSDKAKDVLAKLDKAAQKPRGHYVECCGIRRWVED